MKTLKKAIPGAVSPLRELVEEILSKSEGFALGVKRCRVTVLFADVRNFTSYAERHEPELVMAQLNEYFGHIGEVCLDLGGTLTAYLGDGMMALFGAPISHDGDALRAIGAASRMQLVMQSLRAKW